MNRWLALFGGSLLLVLIVGHLLRDTPGYMVRNPDGTITGDITHYVYWTRLVTLGGVQSAYGGTWPETYAKRGAIRVRDMSDIWSPLSDGLPAPKD